MGIYEGSFKVNTWDTHAFCYETHFQQNWLTKEKRGMLSTLCKKVCAVKRTGSISELDYNEESSKPQPLFQNANVHDGGGGRGGFKNSTTAATIGHISCHDGNSVLIQTLVQPQRVSPFFLQMRETSLNVRAAFQDF